VVTIARLCMKCDLLLSSCHGGFATLFLEADGTAVFGRSIGLGYNRSRCPSLFL
jgi:hypothetical protein